MARQYQSGTGVFLNVTATRQYQSGTGALPNATTTGAPTTPSATVAWTETNDTTSITANAPFTTVNAAVSYTEANDGCSVTGTATSANPTITSGVFENNTGSVLASLTGLTATVLNLTTLAFVKTFTGQTTSSSGVMILSDATLVAGTWYAVVTTNAAGTLGVEKYQAV